MCVVCSKKKSILEFGCSDIIDLIDVIDSACADDIQIELCPALIQRNGAVQFNCN